MKSRKHSFQSRAAMFPVGLYLLGGERSVSPSVLIGGLSRYGAERADFLFGCPDGFVFLLMMLGLVGVCIGCTGARRRTRPCALLVYGGAAVVVLALGVALLYEPEEARTWRERGDAILAQMQDDYEAGRYTAVVDSAERYMDHAETEAPVQELRTRALEDSLEAHRRTDPAVEAKQDRDLYRRLVHFDASNERYVSKLIHYEVRYEVERARREKPVRSERGRQEREERPARDVRNYYVEHAVKSRLENPDRFEHVKTRFADKGDRLYVTMQFRANGAPEVNTAYAIVTLEEQLTVLIIEQGPVQ